jgi:hypothetical protein
MVYKIYLDDIRVPQQTYPITRNGDWVIARNYDEFIKTIESKGMPFFISFDHDLADEHYRLSMYNKDTEHYSKYYTDGTFKEKTGFDCAKWLVEHCMNKNLDLPQYECHSANPVGAANIRSYLESYTKHRQQPTQ